MSDILDHRHHVEVHIVPCWYSEIAQHSASEHHRVLLVVHVQSTLLLVLLELGALPGQEFLHVLRVSLELASDACCAGVLLSHPLESLRQLLDELTKLLSLDPEVDGVRRNDLANLRDNVARQRGIGGTEVVPEVLVKRSLRTLHVVLLGGCSERRVT